MLKRIFCVGFISYSTCLLAGDMGASTAPGNFLMGLGGAYNSVKVQQKILGIGPTKVYDSAGTQIAYGDASGTTKPFNNTQSTFSPAAQIGYMHEMMVYNTSFLGGVKLFYRYLGITSTDRDIDGPQDGSLTNIVTGSTPLVGNFTVESSQLNVNHELDLMAFIAKNMTHSQIYLGVGPSLFETSAGLYRVIGFARVNGVPTDVTGVPGNSFVGNKWVWGGIAQLGLMYHLPADWLIDINYAYSVSERYTIYHSTAFTSYTTIGPATVRTEGTGIVNPTQRITVQGITMTLNKVFSFA